MKRKKFGKTRKDTRWKRGEIVVAEIVRARMKRGMDEMKGV